MENVTLEMADAFLDEWDRELSAKKKSGSQLVASNQQDMSTLRAQ
jgi:hypothetical protein